MCSSPAHRERANRRWCGWRRPPLPVGNAGTRSLGLANAADAEAILRFVRARRPTETSPVGLVFDEVDSTNSSLWDVLVRELRGIPSVYFLGSVRQEDVNLIVDQSDTVFIRIVLDEGLAQQVWEKLFAS